MPQTPAQVTPQLNAAPQDLALTTSPPGEAAAAFCQHFSNHTGTGTATPFVTPPHGARGPPHPPPGPAMQGESRGAGRGRRRAHTPLPPTGGQAWGGGRKGMGSGGPGVDGSRGRGVWREGRAGLGRGVGRGGFPEPWRCGAQGPDVQPEGGTVGEARSGCDSSSSSVSGSGLEVALGPGGVVRGPTPGATGGARVRAERRAE